MRAVGPSPLHATFRVLLPLTIVASALPAGLPAQGPAPVAVGATVRVLTPPPEGWRQGRLVTMDSATLVVVQADETPSTIPRTLVQRVEVRRRPNRVGRALGFGLLGGIVGAVAGGVIGYQSTKCGGCEDPGIGVLLGIPLGGVVGLVGGAVTGASTGARWAPASLPGAPGPSTPAVPRRAGPSGAP